ncbi:hypothetical protein [Macrococcus brunensis]|uniref:hypothetical protein n=1 Tax=Macrococcus brunensis TaxID=198483 RepID=UPI001EF0DBFC|nr:hypothetical protein [Macrococcus brunensis]ULG74175.1 hypothetical protein MGG13_11195 [Macrococcus brunensis]
MDNINFNLISIILTSGLVSGIVVALINNFYNIYNQKRLFNHEINKIKIQNEHQLKLDTNRFLVEKKIEAIQQLKENIAKVCRYDFKVMEKYLKFFSEIDRNDARYPEKWNIINNEIYQMDDNGYIFLEINNNFSYFPELRRIYFENNFERSTVNLTIYLPKQVYEKRDNQDVYLRLINEYSYNCERYRKWIPEFMERLNEEHMKILQELQ